MSTLNMTQQGKRPRVAIVGGGVAGLAAAYDLAGHAVPSGARPSVTIFEGGPQLGGLAAGFKGRSEWDWPLEHFYHHLFTNDDAILKLTEEIGLAESLEVHAPTTVLYVQGERYPFDSPTRLLQFPHLNLQDKLRMGAVLAYLKYHPQPPWQQFDQLLADSWLAEKMGRTGYETVWRPMLQGKFGAHYDEVNLAWFWARVYKRTPKLGYYRGGFQAFVDGLAAAAAARGVALHTESPVQAITRAEDGSFTMRVAGIESGPFDAVLTTVSPGLMARIAPGLPTDYLAQLQQLKSMGAVVLTVALDRQLLTDGAYWVNVPKPEGLPFLALVEHTNMIDPRHYAGDHLLYIGDYLEPDHAYFGLSAQELLAEFLPHFSKFNPAFSPDWVTGAWVHKASYAQPVPPVGYAAMIPDIRTPLPGLYFASMSQVYPWDRGTNYAVEIGRKAAGMVVEDLGLGGD
jgi:protoporphyrinogen oxidase